MESGLVRKTFLDFFREKQHQIVPSAPMVVKDDPTLMFTNAGMNQFKDVFLGNKRSESSRVADTQKCLRVSGKHNDLEEVGRDTYHHTMFEMLGNWSFGDYFKKEAIAWAWELLAGVYGIGKDRMYATVFGGDPSDKLDPDHEAYGYWKEILPEDQILYGSKKDNFWEMGETGPCGPCSEIHVDIRPAEERAKSPGRELVNKDHPEVIEIWNLVFIEFNRKKNGALEALPEKHVDTGMGFERLCMVLQGKRSNYDTDVFTPLLVKLEELTRKAYGEDEDADIAMRVVADHIRAIAFSITDGQLPSNTGAGYVIRRILRRAVRYVYTFLDHKDPVLYQLIDVLAGHLGGAFPELNEQKDLIAKVVREEETSFLKTLEQGIRRFEQYVKAGKDEKIIDGKFAFELFDTYGFPIDLTGLMAREAGWEVDMKGFTQGLEEQKNRSRKAAVRDLDEWVVVTPSDEPTKFLGYEELESKVKLQKYRKVSDKKKTYYELVLDRTPFYAESGGQCGDKGMLKDGELKISIFDTRKENEMVIHLADKDPGGHTEFMAEVNVENRRNTANNHTATHLMHYALRKVLGEHVEQKGSLVDGDHLRFDFSHFQKMTDEEILRVENMVNRMIRANYRLDEHRDVTMDEALEMGALAFFGEKYGERVRVVRFGESTELCGGTHVVATGQIGLFKIRSEGAIAAGVRRIEAITAGTAEKFINEIIAREKQIKELLKNTKDIVKGVENLVEENKNLHKLMESLNRKISAGLSTELRSQMEEYKGVQLVAARIDADNAVAKDLAFALVRDLPRGVVLLGYSDDNKAFLTLALGKEIIAGRGLKAGDLIRELSAEIQGGGGGQPHFATAGGKDPSGIQRALDAIKEML